MVADLENFTLGVGHIHGLARWASQVISMEQVDLQGRLRKLLKYIESCSTPSKTIKKPLKKRRKSVSYDPIPAWPTFSNSRSALTRRFRAGGHQRGHRSQDSNRAVEVLEVQGEAVHVRTLAGKLVFSR